MTEDASLDEFLDAGSEAPDEEPEADEDGEEGDEPATEAPGDADAEPATEAPGDADAEPPERGDAGLSTYDWSPEGAPCAACGTVVERRWRDDTGLVCESCKEW